MMTMYDKVPHWLVFNSTEIMGKFTTKQDAEDYIQAHKNNLNG